MNSEWAQVVTSTLSVLGAGGGLGAAIAAAIRWRKTKADTADVLTDTALTLIEPLRVRVLELEADVVRLRTEARYAANELRRLRIAIMDPAATLDSLRGLVNPQGSDRTP